ncbi:hypothetical protein MKW92_001320 [Papaver armeniacum]|nr:hypothetical protein MKW92_001320 [Papaver armeniacum]
MIDEWWSMLGAAIPSTVAGQALRVKRRRAEEQRIKSPCGREKNYDDIFVCERVCTSKRMLKRVGAFSKDPTPATCITVCGVSHVVFRLYDENSILYFYYFSFFLGPQSLKNNNNTHKP